jgi:hypothetical protein
MEVDGQQRRRMGHHLAISTPPRPLKPTVEPELEPFHFCLGFKALTPARALEARALEAKQNSGGLGRRCNNLSSAIASPSLFNSPLYF